MSDPPSPQLRFDTINAYQRTGVIKAAIGLEIFTHFCFSDCVRFLRRIHAALRDGGRVVIIEFVPNDDRVTPPAAAGFSLMMLGSTPEGDAYTHSEYRRMLEEAGFKETEIQPIGPSPQSAVVATA